MCNICATFSYFFRYYYIFLVNNTQIFSKLYFAECDITMLYWSLVAICDDIILSFLLKRWLSSIIEILLYLINLWVKSGTVFMEHKMAFNKGDETGWKPNNCRHVSIWLLFSKLDKSAANIRILPYFRWFDLFSRREHSFSLCKFKESDHLNLFQ